MREEEASEGLKEKKKCVEGDKDMEEIRKVEKETTMRKRSRIRRKKCGGNVRCKEKRERKQWLVLRCLYAKRRHSFFCNEPRHGNKKAKGSRMRCERMLITDNYKPNKYRIYDSPRISQPAVGRTPTNISYARVARTYDALLRLLWLQGRIVFQWNFHWNIFSTVVQIIYDFLIL